MNYKSIRIIMIFLLLVSTISAQRQHTISVLDLDPSGLSSQEAKVITDRIRSTLPRLGLYTVQERGKMEAIFDEMKFQLSGWRHARFPGCSASA